MISKAEHKTITFRASGKLMLFGEYLVLKGAKSLAFPVKYGQKLEIEPSNNSVIWTSISPSGKWFEASFNSNLDLIESNNEAVAQNLKTLLQIIQKDKPELNMNQVFTMTADFNLEWGFGSSSTLSAYCLSGPEQILIYYWMLRLEDQDTILPVQLLKMLLYTKSQIREGFLKKYLSILSSQTKCYLFT